MYKLTFFWLHCHQNSHQHQLLLPPLVLLMKMRREFSCNCMGKFIVFEPQLLSLFRRCCSCGQEVKLETSAVGTMLVVSGICPDGHVFIISGNLSQ